MMDWQREQGAKCSCKGTDEMCPCQNVSPADCAELARVDRRWRDVIPLIEKIHEEEGATVTFVCPNPDFNSQPNEAVTICNDATDWEERTFRGETLARCLQDAIAYCKASHL